MECIEDSYLVEAQKPPPPAEPCPGCGDAQRPQRLIAFGFPAHYEPRCLKCCRRLRREAFERAQFLPEYGDG